MNAKATGYSFGPITVDVVTDAADAGHWLREFLTPWMPAVRFGQGHVVVRFSCAQDAFETLERRSASAVRLSPCFALDNEIVTLPAWDDGDAVVLADRDLHCFYQVRGHRVDIVGRPGERRTRFGLMRVVREVLTARRLKRGSLLDLHAAAFEAEGRAVLIAGPKCAGKSTLLCYALASGRAGLIANDRVFVDVAREPGAVHGIPTLVGVRRETLRLFPDLRRGTAGQPVLLHAGEDELEPDDVTRGANVRSLSPGQLADRLGAAAVPGAPLSAVVFPEIAAGAGTWTVDVLSRAEGLARLAPCFHGVRRDGLNRTVLEEPGDPVVSPAPAALAERLAGDVRFFRCTLGPRAYERGAAEWLRALGLEPADVRTGRTASSCS